MIVTYTGHISAAGTRPVTVSDGLGERAGEMCQGVPFVVVRAGLKVAP